MRATAITVALVAATILNSRALAWDSQAVMSDPGRHLNAAAAAVPSANNANHAGSAGYANSAGSASTASYADRAGSVEGGGGVKGGGSACQNYPEGSIHDLGNMYALCSDGRWVLHLGDPTR